MCRTQPYQNSLHNVLHEKQTKKNKTKQQQQQQQQIKKYVFVKHGKIWKTSWKLLFPFLLFFRTALVPLGLGELSLTLNNICLMESVVCSWVNTSWKGRCLFCLLSLLFFRTGLLLVHFLFCFGCVLFWLCFVFWLVFADTALFSALLSRLTALACGSTWVTSFIARFFVFVFWISTEVVYLQRWHGWCHMKLQPSPRKSCVHHTTMLHVSSCKATYVRCMHV